MTPFKIILTGALAGLCLATTVRAADYREEPYDEVEARYHTQVIEVPQARPLSPDFHEERTHLGPRYVEERVHDRPGSGWRPWSQWPHARGRGQARIVAGSSNGV
jgi:hypothetical protein